VSNIRAKSWKCSVGIAKLPCVVCVITLHKNHDCSDIEHVSEKLRKLVLGDKDKASELWKTTQDLLPRLEKEKNDVIKHLAGIEDEINKAADKSIAAIQRDREKLLTEVGWIKLKQLKQVETVKQEVERHATALESFKRYSETLLSSGTACDVTRSANSLHERADELMKFDVIGHVDSSLPPANVTFTSSTLLNRQDGNFVLTVTEEGESKYSRCRNKQGRRFSLSIGGRTRGPGGRKSPIGVQGQSPWWGVRGKASKS